MSVQSRILAASIAAIGLHAHAVAADRFPDKPIRLLVGFPPGGANDIVARVLGQRLAEDLAQQVVIDNRPGASGIVANGIVARAPADGYTVLIVPASFAVDAVAGKKLPYDSAQDFAPVSLVASGPLILVGGASFAQRSLADLIQHARANPGRVQYAHAGVGNLTHLAGELLKARAAIDLGGVSYRGAGPALVDLIGGHVPLLFTAVSSAMPHVRTGKIQALAVTSLKRSAALPDVPAMAEAVPGYDAPGWWGLLAPKGTPKPRIDRLHAAIARALRSGDTSEKLAQQGIESVGGTPAEFQAHIRRESDKWAALFRTVSIPIE